MLDSGANPFVLNSTGDSEYKLWSIKNQSTSLTSKPKSIFHTIGYYSCKCIMAPCSISLFFPWFYSSGVFNGKFTRLINGSSRVVEGVLCGKRVVFKFVPLYDDIGALKRQIDEMETYGVDVKVPFYWHYRLVCL